MPSAWQTTVLSPQWKGKGAASDATTYRPISVMHPLAKLLALVLLRRLDAMAEPRGWRAPSQAGFRRGYRLEDHQLLITYLMMAAAQGRGPLAVAFIDIEKAYDKLPRTQLWEVLGT